MVLTYVSITASYVPLVIKGIVEAGAEKTDASAADSPARAPGEGPAAAATDPAGATNDGARQAEAG